MKRKSEALGPEMQGGGAGPHQESTISVSVSAVVKKAKTIQYIIHFTCGHRGSIGWGLRGLCLPTMLGVLWGKGHTQDLNFA